MKRLLTSVLLLFAGVGLVRADYAIITTGGDKADPLVKGKEASPPLAAFLEYSGGGKYEPEQLKLEMPKGQQVGLIYHRWGKSALILDGDGGTQVKQIAKLPTVGKRAESRRAELERAKDRTAEDYRREAEWMLTNGMLADQRYRLGEGNDKAFQSLLDEMVNRTDKGDKSAVVAAAAVKELREKLKKTPTRDDVAAWKDKGLPNTTLTGNRYTLLCENATDPQAKGRLDRLERNFLQFYYWFALRGKALPLPERRLMAVLVADPKRYEELRHAFGDVPAVTDAFCARRDALLVLCQARADGSVMALEKQKDDMATAGWNFDLLLRGGAGWPKSVNDQLRTNPQAGATLWPEIFRAMTIALVRKALAEESELAGVSHEGTHQLLIATGLMPRTVVLPEWLQVGLPSAFETPRYDPVSQVGAFWPTFAAPHWVYLTYFKLWDRNKSALLESPEVALRGVLADRYFHEANGDPDKVLRARVMAWALSYYLLQNKLDGLFRYAEELNALPRDLELDEDTHVACFARAFNLTKSGKPDEIDPAKWQVFAADWYRALGGAAPPLPEILTSAQKVLSDKRPSLLAPLKKE